MKILMVAPEATPFAKTGGLADVVGALSATLRSLGHEIAVFMPRYAHVSLQGLPRVYQDLRVWFGPTCHTCTVYEASDRGVCYWLLDCPHLFDREGIYGDEAGDYPDNHARFAVLNHAALNVIRYLFRPDIIHCHDWQTGLLPTYIKTRYALDPSFIGPKTVFTIHNLGYKGLFPRTALAEVGLDDALFSPGLLEFDGQISYLKAGLVYSDALTTVSRAYAREIQTPELGFGLESTLQQRADVLWGIQNGVDYSEWDPSVDTHIAARYTPEDLSGKRACKADLLGALGMEENLERPLIGIVSRLAGQKGFDLIEEAGDALMAEDVALAVLGSGDPRYENLFRDLAERYPGRVGLYVGYNNELAHKIEAGADLFLMPSEYEPSGLNQIYSLRYGTVPVVRATGGLDDTVEAGVTGFKFREYTGAALLSAMRTALAAYGDRKRWNAIVQEGMRRDYSWARSAREYEELYRGLAGKAARAAA
ncbi:MAG TPA: glycogen synthase GlgA [Bryobacteraceae bacterium]|nr:glycogen synthase GlgA [Bryobacteraceae bacterium]